MHINKSSEVRDFTTTITTIINIIMRAGKLNPFVRENLNLKFEF